MNTSDVVIVTLGAGAFLELKLFTPSSVTLAFPVAKSISCSAIKLSH